MKEEISVTELTWQIRIKYVYLASLSPQRSAEREVYRSFSNDIDRELRVGNAAVELGKWIKLMKRKIADTGWKLEFRERWQKEVDCSEHLLKDLERFGATVALLEHVQQQIEQVIEERKHLAEDAREDSDWAYEADDQSAGTAKWS